MNAFVRAAAYVVLFFTGCSGESPRPLQEPERTGHRFTIGFSREGQHSDADTLLNAVLPIAEMCIDKWGQFYPFAASMKSDGRIVIHVAEGVDTVFPHMQEHIDILRDAFTGDKARGEIRAFALCYDVVLRNDTNDMNGATNAIRIDIEHETEGAVRIHVPYRMDTIYGVEYDSLSVSALSPLVFTGIRI